MCVVGVRVKERDRDGLDPFVADLPRRVADALLVELHPPFAPRAKAFAHLVPQPPRDERRRRFVLDVVEHGDSQAAHLEHVTESLRRDERGLGAVPFEDRVRRDCRGMHDVRDLFRADAVPRQQGHSAGEHATRVVVRRRQHLRGAHRAVVAEQDDVGEGAADVDAEPEGPLPGGGARGRGGGGGGAGGGGGGGGGGRGRGSGGGGGGRGGGRRQFAGEISRSGRADRGSRGRGEWLSRATRRQWEWGGVEVSRAGIGSDSPSLTRSSARAGRHSRLRLGRDAVGRPPERPPDALLHDRLRPRAVPCLAGGEEALVAPDRLAEPRRASRGRAGCSDRARQNRRSTSSTSRCRPLAR